jgi:hypothetical protein
MLKRPGSFSIQIDHYYCNYKKNCIADGVLADTYLYPDEKSDVFQEHNLDDGFPDISYDDGSQDITENEILSSSYCVELDSCKSVISEPLPDFNDEILFDTKDYSCLSINETLPPKMSRKKCINQYFPLDTNFPKRQIERMVIDGGELAQLNSESFCSFCSIAITQESSMRRCAYCTKPSCLSSCCRKCDSCEEIFCRFCTYINYTFDYERLLCPDCNY